MEILLEILKYILPLLLGGGLVTLFTLNSLKKLKKSEASFSELETFQKRITSYNTMITDMDLKINDLVNKSKVLDKKYISLQDKYKKLIDKYIVLQKEYKSLLRRYNNLKNKTLKNQ